MKRHNINSYKANRPTLKDKIEGCLVGAAIGAEFGWARMTDPKRFDVANAEDVFNIHLEPAKPFPQHPKRINIAKSTPFTALGVRSYCDKQGRVTPEDFGRELMNDKDLAKPVFMWDLIHTTQELLKEGMNPRLSGIATASHGLFVAAMPAVGIYHLADPDHAYLDGVELASVGQPRLSADWAGLAAAAVAAAFDPEQDAKSIINTVLNLAMENNKEVFTQLHLAVRAGRHLFKQPQQGDYFKWRHVHGSDVPKEFWGIAMNPLRLVLPLLEAFDGDAQKLMVLLLWPNNGAHMVAPIVAGAILGARHGKDVFPDAWLEWAAPVATPWFAMEKVVGKRIRTEKAIIAITERLAKKTGNNTTLLEDKIYGCLLASSIGNAMGSPMEGLLYEEIDAKYPGGVKTILEPERLESEDDNQMAMLLVETYLQRDGRPVMARHFGQTWNERLNRYHFYSYCMGNACDLIRSGWDPRITGHWSVVTGSTVMCMEPAGLYDLADPEFAAIDATAISYMYQRGLDVTAAAILAATVAEALRPDATVDSVCKAALAAAPQDRFRTFDRRPFKSCRDYLETCLSVAHKYDDVMAARKELYAKCLLYHFIDPLELLGLALAMFKIAKGDVRQAAIGGTNIGRDSDTIAGRAAMLSGILRGASNVPREWVSMFSKESLDKIDRNAERLADLVVKCKLPGLKKRQNIGGENK